MKGNFIFFSHTENGERRIDFPKWRKGGGGESADVCGKGEGGDEMESNHLSNVAFTHREFYLIYLKNV